LNFFKFYNKEGIFVEESIKNPIAFWKHIKMIKKEYMLLANIGIYLASFPMSSVAVERSFSLLRHTHTWKRSCLNRKTLKKLIYIQYNTTSLFGSKNKEK